MAKGKVTAGQLTAMLTYLTVAHSLLSNVGDLIENYPLLTNAAERVCWVYQDPERTKGASAAENPEITGQDISFSYQEKKVLHKVCFSIRAGDKVCIVGENGSGKTTLCKLMLALREGYTGSLFIGGQELRELAPESIRHRLVYAEQRPHLFRATALENILLGDESIHREAAEKLMESLGILHLINRQVDDESELSGGERQKIAIARALVRPADVWILDEPTNHLDQKSADFVRKCISETDKTVIVVTHDPSLLSLCNVQLHL